MQRCTQLLRARLKFPSFRQHDAYAMQGRGGGLSLPAVPPQPQLGQAGVRAREGGNEGSASYRWLVAWDRCANTKAGLPRLVEAAASAVALVGPPSPLHPHPTNVLLILARPAAPPPGMGAPAPPPATASTGAVERRPRRVPQRLLAAAAVVVALAVALLALGAVGAGHTELRLTAGVQLSIGSFGRAGGAAEAGGAGGAEEAGGKQQAQVQGAQRPPLPEGKPPPRDHKMDAEEEGVVSYGGNYEEAADMLTLLGAKELGAGKASSQPATISGAVMPKPAKGKPVVTAESAAARESGIACGEVRGPCLPACLACCRPCTSAKWPLCSPPTVAFCHCAPHQPLRSASPRLPPDHPLHSARPHVPHHPLRCILQALYVKKVALMFLTTRRLAHEKLWRLWMWDAAGMVPLQALPLAQVRLNAAHCNAAQHKEGRLPHGPRSGRWAGSGILGMLYGLAVQRIAGRV